MTTLLPSTHLAIACTDKSCAHLSALSCDTQLDLAVALKTCKPLQHQPGHELTLLLFTQACPYLAERINFLFFLPHTQLDLTVLTVNLVERTDFSFFLSHTQLDLTVNLVERKTGGLGAGGGLSSQVR